MKKLSVLMLIALISVSAVFSSGTAENASDVAAEVNPEIGERFENTVKISILNSKPEITDALEKGLALFGSAYNVDIEIYETDSPAVVIAQRYAAGDPPTLAILGASQVLELAGERIEDLSGEPWEYSGGSDKALYVDGKLYGMPLTIEGMSILYNKTAIENTLGREIDPDDYQSFDDFKAFIEELVASGMETPFVINSEDWSVGHQMLQYIYSYQDGTAAGAIAFLNDVNAGETTFIENDVFNKAFDLFDLFFKYNINRDDPLAADYDLNASYMASGEAAFWINGTWAWPDFEPYAEDDMEYGIFHFPINDNPGQGKVVAGATKYFTLDAEKATEEQQKAAKMLLNWLVFDPAGQQVLITDCQIVTAFTNIEIPATNPFNLGMQEYISQGRTVDTASYLPSDHRAVLAENMQAYLAGRITREDMASIMTDYWRSRTPNV